MKKYTLFMILFIFLIGISTGCNNSNLKDQSRKEIEDAITNGIEYGNFNDLNKLLEDNKLKGKDLSSYNDDQDFSSFIVSKLKNNKVGSFNDQLIEILDKYQYKNESVKNQFIKNNINDKNDTKEKLSFASKYHSYKYYGNISITKEEINKYIEENNTPITKNKNTNGYYDDSTHRFKTVNKDILSNGDIITTSAEYFGDFAIYNKDREYLDINFKFIMIKLILYILEDVN